MPSGAPPASDAWIAVGIIRRPHGVRGEMSVELLTDRPERMRELQQVFLVSPDRSRHQSAKVLSARPHGDRALVRVDAIDSPESVRDYRDWTLEIDPADARELDEGEHFVHDLIGLEVADLQGTVIGETADAIEGGSGLLLVVNRRGGGSFEMPFAESIVKQIDHAGGRMVVDLPEGLEDLSKAEEVSQNLSPAAPRLRVDIVTIFPRMFEAFLEEGIIARGRQEGVLEIRIWDLREFTTDKHRSTDDEAYGGGAGMVMLPEPVFRCVDAIRESGEGTPVVLMTSPQGERFSQSMAGELAAEGWLVLLCGRYEGFDERIREALVDREVSVGDFVVSGGEIPAMLVVDAVARLVEGVVGDWNSVEADSFYSGLLDHPHYTRPRELRGMEVPEVLLSGHAENIRKWRKEQALRATLRKRPDLLERAVLDDEAREMLSRIRREPSE